MSVFKIAFLGTPEDEQICEIAQKQFGWEEGRNSSIELINITEKSNDEVLQLGSFHGLIYYDNIKTSPKCMSHFENILSNVEELKDISLFALTHGKAQSDIASINTVHEIESYLAGVVKPTAEIFNDRAGQVEKSAKSMLDKLVKLVIDATEHKHDYTAGHVDRVSKYTKAIAQELGFSEKEIEEVSLAAKLHDIGKIVVKDSILAKKAGLRDEEKKEMGEHTSQGVAILETVLACAPELAEYITPEVIKGVGYHHKEWDGKNAAKRRAEAEGKKIVIDPINHDEVGKYASAIAVADCIDAMTSQRAYNNPKHILGVFRDLATNRHTQFKPDVAEAAMIVLAQEIASLGIDPLKLVPEQSKPWNIESDKVVKEFLEANADRFEVNKDAKVGAYSRLGFRLDKTGHFELEGKHSPVRDLNIPYQDKISYRGGEDAKKQGKKCLGDLDPDEIQGIADWAYNFIMADEKEGEEIMARAAEVPLLEESPAIPIKPMDVKKTRSLEIKLYEMAKRDREVNSELAKNTSTVIFKEMTKEQTRETEQKMGEEK